MKGIFGVSWKSKFLSAARHSVRSLFLFGSAITDPDKSRDFDFVVDFAQLSPGEHVERYFGLMEDLEKLFGRPVDLVEMRAVKNPFFKQEIEEKKVLLYDAA